MTLARYDTWVRATMGPAAAGARVFICSQPATVSTNPSPQVQLYADNAGVTPISQPLVCDGFGHASCYVASGIYTVVIVYGGSLVLSYPDQNIAVGSGGSGMPVTGLPSIVTASAGAIVTSDGAGNIQATGPVIPVFKTAGVINPVQSLLNLVAGPGIGLTADSLGDVTIATTQTGPPSGQNVWMGAYSGLIPSNFGQGVFGGNTCTNMLPGRLALCMPASWKVTLESFGGNSVIVTACSICICNADSPVVSSSVPVTFNGGATTASYTTQVTSDPINIQIDATHDYYLMVYYDPGSGDPGYWQVGPYNQNFGAEYSSVNNTAPANINTTHSPSNNGYVFFKSITVT